MAGDAVIGALRVVLGLDTATFEDNAKKASGVVQSFASRVTDIASGVGLEHALEKVFHAITEEVVKAFESIDRLGKSAQKLGLTVEELSALAPAAALSDVSIESLSTGLGKLSKAMLETSKNTGDAREKFKAMGVSVTDGDGKLRSVGDVLNDLADRFSKSSDGAAKTATALALLGRGGKELIPLLNEGSDNLREMTEAAQRMGLVIGKDTFEQVQKFNDNLKLLNLAKQGLVNQIVAGVIPALLKLSDSFVETAKSGDYAKGIADRVVKSFQEIVVAAYQTIIADELLGKAFQELQNILLKFPDIDASAAAYENFKEIIKQFVPAMDAARQVALDLFTAITVNKHPTQDLETEVDHLTKTIIDLQIKARVLRDDFAGLPVGFVEVAKGLKLFADKATESRTTIESLSPELQKLALAQLNFNAAQTIQQNLQPWAQYEQQLQRLNMQLQYGMLNQDQFALASRNAAVATQQAWDVAGASITGNLATGLKAFAAQNQSLSAAAKAAAIAQAIFNTYTAASKALATYPPPLSYAAAAAAVVAGLGYVAQIRAQTFATGGSFKVGGSGGVDTQLVQFMATPGEMVDVRTPAQQRSESREVTLRGMSPDDLFNGRWLRGLVETLNAGDRDGYRLKFAER